jgi:hypothetical protein
MYGINVVVKIALKYTNAERIPVLAFRNCSRDSLKVLAVSPLKAAKIGILEDV